MGHDGQTLTNALTQTRKELMESVERWRQFGIELALAERDYRIEFRKEVFILHETDDVKSWTAAVELARGELDTVADLRYLRDVKKVQYDAEAEVINVLKINCRIIEGEIKMGMQGY